MINFVNKNPYWRWLLEEEISRLEHLVSDLRRLLDGDYPTDGELDEAVVLINPVTEPFLTSALKGRVVDHPELGNRAVVTSPVVVQASDWCRTENRLYLLASSQPVGDPS